MPEKTIYEYATKSWPIANGCSPNMPCAPRCWAKRTVARLAGSPNAKVRAAHEGLVRVAGAPYRDRAGEMAMALPSLSWTGTVRLNEAHLTDPLKWRNPQRVATGYHGDLFRLPAEQIDRVFAVMALCPQHMFLVLTKAAREMREYIEPLTESHCYARGSSVDRILAAMNSLAGVDAAALRWPLPNVWLGVSVMNQADADERREPMGALAAAGWNTWVSAEPQIQRIDWRGWEFLRWLTPGGESGANARPFDLQWMRNAIFWGRAHGIPVFAKQVGARPYAIVQPDGYERPYRTDPELSDPKGADPSEWPEDLRVREMPVASRGQGEVER